MIYKKVDVNVEHIVLRVLRHYDFDTSKVEIYQNTLANNNKVFLIKQNRQKFILRQSSMATTLKHLQLEVAVLQYLHNKNFQLTPFVLPNIHGMYITSSCGCYYILQNFLSGEVKKGVNNLTRFNPEKVISFFTGLAQFSRAVQNFDGEIPRDNKPLYYYARNATKLYKSLSSQIKDCAIKKLLQDNTPFIKDFVTVCKSQMEDVHYDGLPKQIVHFDLHPGNANFQGDIVTGIFDFDWVRFDNRITDLACSIGQSCYHYRGKNRARYDVEKIRLALESYRRAYGKSKFSIQAETRLIAIALKAYMVYQLLWIIEWHLKNPNDTAGYRHIEFSLDVLKLNNFDKLVAGAS